MNEKRPSVPNKIYDEGLYCEVVSELTSIIFSYPISVFSSPPWSLKIWHILKVNLLCAWAQKKIREVCILAPSSHA